MKAYLPKLLENGIILAALTAMAYYLTYLRLDGALAAYALPNDFIDIDATDIIETTIYLIYKFWQVLIIPGVGLIVCNLSKNAEITRLCRFSIVMITSVLFSMALLGRFEPNNWILLGILLYEWAEVLVLTLICGRNHKLLHDKWMCYLQKTGETKTAESRVAIGVAYLAIAIAVMYVLSGAVTEHAALEALNREDFFIAADYEDQVVIFETDECYVLMKRDGDQLLPNYEVVRYDHIGKLTYLHTGVLRLPDGYPAVN